MDINNIPLWSKETLQFSSVKKILNSNKDTIYALVENFTKENPNIKDFYIAGSSAFILQNYIAKKHVRDVDIYCPNQEAVKTPQVDLIKNDLFPPGWQNRIVTINGYKVISAFDSTCAIACCYLKQKVIRHTVLLLMLREFDLNILKQALQDKLNSGIGVTESDFKSVKAFNRDINPKVIELNRHPQQELISYLQEIDKNSNS